MSVGTPDEFKYKTPMTVGAIVWIATISFSMGMLYKGNVEMDKQIDKNLNQNRSFTEQEVGGLRSDWERQNRANENDRDDLRQQIKDLQKYHKQKE